MLVTLNQGYKGRVGLLYIEPGGPYILIIAMDSCFVKPYLKIK